MKRSHLSCLLLLAGCLPLAACGNSPVDDAIGEAERAVAEVDVEMSTLEREIRDELATGNIDFGGEHHMGDDRATHESDAEITPEGDLLVAGKPVEVDAQERAMLLAYRQQVTDVALAGAKIGLQGAALAKTAMSEAFRGVLSGNTEEIEAKVEAEAAKIEAQVVVLCDRLPPLLETQEALAASIPELEPYATMSQDDIDQCYDEHEEARASLETASY